VERARRTAAKSHGVRNAPEENYGSSRTRSSTDQFAKAQRLRRAAAMFLAGIPKELRETADAKRLAEVANDKVYSIIHIIYYDKDCEGTLSDWEFSRQMMEEHWNAGYYDALRTLSHAEALRRPDGKESVLTFDPVRDGVE
jgi:NTE family protein